MQYNVRGATLRAHPMQHNVHGVVLGAAAGGGQRVRSQRDGAGGRGQAVLHPHVRGQPLGQAAPIAAEPVRVHPLVERLQCVLGVKGVQDFR